MSEKIKVLVCEDHTIFRAGIKSALQSKEDIEIVGEAVDGQDLLKKLNYITPDVILLDINMPRMDGPTVLSTIRATEAYNNIKVIMLSMENGASMVTKMMRDGANSYLSKNDESELIYEAIVTCHEQGYFFNKLTNQSLLKTVQKNSVILDEDVELKKIEQRRIEKLKVLNSTTTISEVKVEQPKEVFHLRIPRYIIKGIVTGLIAGIIIIFIVYALIVVSNNLNFNNFTP